MTIIKQIDVIDSVADALQYISYYHPKDFVDAMTEAYEKEQHLKDYNHRMSIRNPVDTHKI